MSPTDDNGALRTGQGAPRPALNIVGAGLAGALLAVLLARRGFKITLYDRRSTPGRPPRKVVAQSI